MENDTQVLWVGDIHLKDNTSLDDIQSKLESILSKSSSYVWVRPDGKYVLNQEKEKRSCMMVLFEGDSANVPH